MMTPSSPRPPERDLCQDKILLEMSRRLAQKLVFRGQTLLIPRELRVCQEPRARARDQEAERDQDKTQTRN